LNLGLCFTAISGKHINMKSEALNPKQYPMIKIQMTKTVGG